MQDKWESTILRISNDDSIKKKKKSKQNKTVRPWPVDEGCEECYNLPPTSAAAASVIRHWAEVEVLLLLGFAYPVPITHVLQASFEVVLGYLVVSGSFFGLTIGEFQ